LFTLPLVSIGLGQSSLARFSASEEIAATPQVGNMRDEQMYADDRRYQEAAADATALPDNRSPK
jgi:NADH dehydrogenase